MTGNAANPNLPENGKCPQCGTPLPAGVLAELCPACLLKQGALADSATRPEGRPFIPPSVAEIAQLFPQLEIIAFIGKGGMGAVYQARQKQLDRIVALKILPPGIGGDAAFAERFAREAKALARLNHPGIVTLYEFGSQPSAGGSPPLYYFLMEFVDGVNLRQLLQTGRVSPREALAIVPQICDALQFAHDQGIVHRDIKPENILLDRRGRVKVADFGLAKLVGTGNEPAAGGAFSAGSPALTDAGKIIGTPRYMAPEQVERPGDVDHRADIYALGVVFYQMLTGELPDKRMEPPSHKVHIDVRLDEIVLRALEKKPELRYQQASALKTQIETIAAAPAPAVNSGNPAGPSASRDYRTQQTIFGIPWVHVAWGTDPATGKPRVAQGVVAVGTVAKGVVAVGLEAYGVIATGLLAVGIAPVGLFALGFFTSGIFSVGIQAVGILAIGFSAVGIVAIGLDTVGVVSAGRHAVGSLKPKWVPGIFFAAMAASCLGVPLFRGILRSASRPPGTTSPRRPAKGPMRAALIALACLALPLAILAFFTSRSRAPQYGVWAPQTMSWNNSPAPDASAVYFSDISQNGRVANFSLTCEPGSPLGEM
ncbi:MAG TPA: serine/threonine-protein kinase, partial [Candidatus Cybelea sp.]|nr:serine/threonine-protein kinase [Candidatus Cybelea sp.]